MFLGGSSCVDPLPGLCGYHVLSRTLKVAVIVDWGQSSSDCCCHCPLVLGTNYCRVLFLAAVPTCLELGEPCVFVPKVIEKISATVVPVTPMLAPEDVPQCCLGTQCLLPPLSTVPTIPHVIDGVALYPVGRCGTITPSRTLKGALPKHWQEDQD